MNRKTHRLFGLQVLPIGCDTSVFTQTKCFVWIQIRSHHFGIYSALWDTSLSVSACRSLSAGRDAPQRLYGHMCYRCFVCASVVLDDAYASVNVYNVQIAFFSKYLYLREKSLQKHLFLNTLISNQFIVYFFALSKHFSWRLFLSSFPSVCPSVRPSVRP